jgi:hypothetical protein
MANKKREDPPNKNEKEDTYLCDEANCWYETKDYKAYVAHQRSHQTGTK